MELHGRLCEIDLSALGARQDAVHVSRATRALFAERFPWVRTAFVAPGKTSVSQPADIAFMAPFKEILRRTATDELSLLILTKLDEGESLKKVLSGPFLKRKIVSWVESSLCELSMKEKIYENAWRHLLVSEEHRAAIEAKAEEEHLLKNLFRQSRKDVVPEEPPLEGEIEIEQNILHEPEDDWVILEHDALEEPPSQIPPEATVAVELDAPAESPLAAGPETQTETLIAAGPEVPPETPVAAQIAPSTTLVERLRALRIVYGGINCALK